MKIKGLVVADLIDPMATMGSGYSMMEEACLLQCRICREEKNGYMDVKSGRKFGEKQILGCRRVEENTVVPLSDYYHILGIRKRNNHQNKEEVWQKVKELKTEGKI